MRTQHVTSLQITSQNINSNLTEILFVPSKLTQLTKCSYDATTTTPTHFETKLNEARNMTRKTSPPKPKRNPTKSIPAYKSQAFHIPKRRLSNKSSPTNLLKRAKNKAQPTNTLSDKTNVPDKKNVSMSTKLHHLHLRPSIHVIATKDDRPAKVDSAFRKKHQTRQAQDIAKMIQSSIPDTVNVIVKSDDRVSKIVPNVNFHDIEMAKMVGTLTSFTGVTDAQVKRGIRFANTMGKLARVLLSKDPEKVKKGEWAQGAQTLELLDEHVKDLIEVREMIEKQIGPDKKTAAPPAEVVRRDKKKKKKKAT